jgi:hypothetical protein
LGGGSEYQESEEVSNFKQTTQQLEANLKTQEKTIKGIFEKYEKFMSSNISLTEEKLETNS